MTQEETTWPTWFLFHGSITMVDILMQVYNNQSGDLKEPCTKQLSWSPIVSPVSVGWGGGSIAEQRPCRYALFAGRLTTTNTPNASQLLYAGYPVWESSQTGTPLVLCYHGRLLACTGPPTFSVPCFHSLPGQAKSSPSLGVVYSSMSLLSSCYFLFHFFTPVLSSLLSLLKVSKYFNCFVIKLFSLFFVVNFQLMAATICFLVCPQIKMLCVCVSQKQLYKILS